MKRVHSVLLCLVMMATVAIPITAQQAQAASGSDGTISICYQPAGQTNYNSPAGSDFRLYRIATVVNGAYVVEDQFKDLVDEDLSSYNPLAPAVYSEYYQSEDNVYDVDHRKADNNPVNRSAYDDAQKLLKDVGTYINANENTANQKTPVATAPVVNGVATFTGLTDGLYLGSLPSTMVYSSGSTTYTPIPFILSLPYVTQVDGKDILNGIVTVTPKIYEYTPPTGGGGRDRNPRPSTPPSTDVPVNPPDNPPDNPSPPPPVDIPDEPVPLVDIPDNPTPLVDIPDNPTPTTNPPSPNVNIPDKPVPRSGRLPQTGLLWWPVPVMAVMGAAMVVFGWRVRGKAESRR